MAESIAIHFRTAAWEEIAALLDSVASRDYAGPGDPKTTRWLYPPTDSSGFHNTVSIYNCESWIDELENEELDAFLATLGDLPSVTVCIELRRSRQRHAADDTEKLTILLLEQFSGVAHDSYYNYWSLEEIRQGVEKTFGRFLDVYRFPARYYKPESLV